MGVVPMQSKDDRAASGSGMDRVVEKRGFSTRSMAIAGAAAVVVAGLLFWRFAPSQSSQTVAADRVTVSAVTRGTFDDFIPLRARVTPLVTVFIDAVEGGRVEKLLVEDGANVSAGQPIALLSNAELQLSTLARQTEVEQQINNMRSQEFAFAQTGAANQRAVLEAELALDKARRQYEREQPLVSSGFLSAKQFADTSDQYDYERRRYETVKAAQATDTRLQTSQLRQQQAAAQSMQSGLAIARANLDALQLRAPVVGQLSGFSVQVGQSLQRGERVGQIDSPGRNKLIAAVDEFYLGRVQLQQKAALEWNGKRYAAKVTRISPQVQNGQFQVDLQFVGEEPQQIQRGQTLQARLTLDDPAPALLVPNGAFYGDTGGSWIFVVAPDGRAAVRRPVRLGRRNVEFIEVLEGLEPGEKVLTSPYTGLTDKTRLDLTQ